MDYLTLCQTLRRECGDPGDGPASVVGQTGAALRFVNWANRAWLKIQTSQPNWNWMRSTATKELTESVQGYVRSGIVASRFGRWDLKNWVVYPTASGITASTPLAFMEFDDFEQQFVFKAVEDGLPKVFTIGPDEKVYLGPAPDATGYTIRTRYIKGAQTLSANADVPELPEDYHWIIVWEAMKYYARREAAGEIMSAAVEGYGLELDRLMRDQLDIGEWEGDTLA